MAAIIKVALMLKRRKVVPFISGDAPLRHYDMQASPFFFSRALSEWGGIARVAEKGDLPSISVTEDHEF